MLYIVLASYLASYNNNLNSGDNSHNIGDSVFSSTLSHVYECDVIILILTPYSAELGLYKPWRPKGFFQFEIIKMS